MTGDVEANTGGLEVHPENLEAPPSTSDADISALVESVSEIQEIQTHTYEFYLVNSVASFSILGALLVLIVVEACKRV